jgi:hypothetical protein
MRNYVLCLPQMSLYYMNVTHHRTTSRMMCAQVTWIDHFTGNPLPGMSGILPVQSLGILTPKKMF